MNSIPDEFPLKYSYPLARLDQQFITDRDRFWEAEEESTGDDTPAEQPE